MNPSLLRQKENIEKLPRTLCESTLTAATGEGFVILLSSGATDTAYAFTPEHAKQFVQSMQHQVAEFEKNVRPINAQWTPNTPSPIQPSQNK